MKEQIVKYLIENFSAEVILLHGSRARETADENSDWDLLVFIKNISQESLGIKYLEQNLDIKFVEFSVLNIENFLDDYPQSTQKCSVLHDSEDQLGARILSAAVEKYSLSKPMSVQEKEHIKAHLERMIQRLKNAQNNNILFGYHLSSFYIKSIRYWFEYKDRWSQPIREALIIIEGEDPDFYEAICILSSEKIPKNVLQAVEIMERRILVVN